MSSNTDLKVENFNIDPKTQEGVGLCLVSLRTKLNKHVTKRALYAFLLEGFLATPAAEESFCLWFTEEWLKRGVGRSGNGAP